jgi:geranylgeranyl reductase family protein
MIVDAAVIGAGPAGAVTAYHLAKNGINVALIDQAVFPRQKTCGDLVTRAGLSWLQRSGLDDWARQFTPIQALKFTSPDEQVINVKFSGMDEACVGRIIPRLLLDDQIVRAAVKSGASLMDGCKVDQVDLTDSSRIHVRTSSGVIDADLVILADGSRAPVTRKLGLIKTDFDLWAVQQYLEDVSITGAIEFHFQSTILPGYTWLIPMGDGSINIGAGTYTSRIRNKEIDLTAILEQFKAHHPIFPNKLIGCKPITAIRAHPLRTDLNATQTHSTRLMVVGDAAGLVSPFTGEGIASAMVSGELAAAYAKIAFEKGDFSQSMLAPYSRELHKRYEPDKKIARFLRSVLRSPSLLNLLFNRMGKIPQLGQLFGQVFMDEESPQSLVKTSTLAKLVMG